MRNQYLRILIALFSVAGSAMVARGQVQNPIVFKADHPFVVAGRNLPPGTYIVKRANDANPRVLTFTNSENQAKAFVLPIWSRGAHDDNVTVTFEQIAGQYFLKKFQTANDMFVVDRSAIAQARKRNSTSASDALGKD